MTELVTVQVVEGERRPDATLQLDFLNNTYSVWEEPVLVQSNPRQVNVKGASR